MNNAGEIERGARLERLWLNQLKGLQDSELLLFLQLRFRAGIVRGGIHGLGFVRTRSRIHIPRLDVDERVLAQLREVRAQSRFQLLHVDGFLDLVLHLRQRRNTGILVFGDLDDDEPLLRADRIGVFTRLQRENFVLEFLRQCA